MVHRSNALVITPSNGFTSSGARGGPFTVTSQSLTLTNTGNRSLDWSLAITSPWLDASPAGGTLAPGGAAATVLVSLNSAAGTLAGGTYTATIWFTNLNDSVSQNRNFTLNVGNYFTELFDTAITNLAFTTFTFIPDGSPQFYHACQHPALAFPTDPTGGSPLTLTDDSYAPITLSGGPTVAIYNTRTSVLDVGSNGYLILGSGDTTYTPSYASHFDRPRISALFCDLNPSAGGNISWKQLPDRLAVTYVGVPTYISGTQANSFQVEMFFNCQIRITYLSLDAPGALVGLSAGTGQPPDFVPSDFTGYGSCPVIQPVLVPGGYSRSANGDFQFTLVGTPGSEYYILCSTNPEDWRVLATIQITNTTSVFVDTNATSSRCFYRAGLLP